MAKARLNRKRVRRHLSTKKPSKSRDRALEILDDMDDDSFEIGFILLLEILSEDLDLSDTYTWVETGEEPQFDFDDDESDDESAAITGEASETFEVSETFEAPDPAPAPEPVSSPDPEPSSYESSYDSGGGSDSGGGGSDD